MDVKTAWLEDVKSLATDYVAFLSRMLLCSISITKLQFILYKDVALFHNAAPSNIPILKGTTKLPDNNELIEISTLYLDSACTAHEDFPLWRDFAPIDNKAISPDAKFLCGACYILTSSGTIRLTIESIVDDNLVMFYNISVASPVGYDRVFEGMDSYWRAGTPAKLSDAKKNFSAMLRASGR